MTPQPREAPPEGKEQEALKFLQQAQNRVLEVSRKGGWDEVGRQEAIEIAFFLAGKVAVAKAALVESESTEEEKRLKALREKVEQSREHYDPDGDTPKDKWFKVGFNTATSKFLAEIDALKADSLNSTEAQAR